nr:unnamed protein product [Callosobruchus analis]
MTRMMMKTNTSTLQQWPPLTMVSWTYLFLTDGQVFQL